MRSKAILKRALTLFLLLCITLTATASLSSCSVTAGSDTLLPLEELVSNVKNSEDRGYTYAASYLDAWDFPAFDIAKMKDVEYVLQKNYITPLPGAYELAKETAYTFLNLHYESTDPKNVRQTTDNILKIYVDTVGDDFTNYFTVEEYGSYTSANTGTAVGIGIVVTLVTEGGYGLLIDEVLEGSAAEAAGLLAGDNIVAVDGVSLEGYNLNLITALITGEAGTRVTLTVKRGEQTLNVTAMRAMFEQKTVSYSLEGDIGYISITKFLQNTDEQFADALDYMRENGARTIIYDLRSNTGGSLDTVVNMISMIAPSGSTIVSFTGGGFEPITDLDPDSLSINSVILVNELTASAAELFTAAVRELSDEGGYETVIVGKRTFGKGIMQSVYSFSDGSGIKFTVAYYNPPS